MKRRDLFRLARTSVAAFLVWKYGRPDHEPMRMVRATDVRWSIDGERWSVDGEQMLVVSMSEIDATVVCSYTLERQFTEPLFPALTDGRGRAAHGS